MKCLFLTAQHREVYEDSGKVCLWREVERAFRKTRSLGEGCLVLTSLAFSLSTHQEDHGILAEKAKLITHHTNMVDNLLLAGNQSNCYRIPKPDNLDSSGCVSADKTTA